ncbi:MAG: SDR family oxidoreductase [Lentisphaerae bacterium]|nr:SDR family oxidoreductase [Lentisphaerota bacterium]
MKERILVTGGAGFLGSYLCRCLLDQGKQVVCVDNLYTGTKRNILPLLENPDFTFLQHDVVEPLDLEVNAIYNLACPASPVHYQKDHVQTVRTCVNGAYNMLELAKKNNCKILQASTSEVYGDPAVHPQVEEYWGNVNPVGIRSCYDEGKRCAETLFNAYHLQYGLPIKLIRIFNTYGPGMHPQDGRVVSNFIMQALQDQDITIYGDGKQTRSFCYRDDLIDGMMRMMATDAAVTGPFNLGNPGEFTMLELAELTIELTNSNSKIVFRPLPSDDPKQRKPNTEKAQKYLGWSAKTPLREGLAKTIEYFDSLLRSGEAL